MEAPGDKALDSSRGEGLDFRLAVQIFCCVVVGVLLSLIGGVAGWLVGGGMMNRGFNSMTLIGSGIGFLVGFLLGFFTFGPGRSVIKTAIKKNYPPDAERLKYGLGMTTFSIYMTVHEVRNVTSSEGIFSYFGKANDSYVEVRVGRKLGAKDNFTPNYHNPVKRTCVQQNGKFGEGFKLNIDPRDDCIEVRLMDQDFAGDDIVGTAEINISNEIIGQGFPQTKGYKIMHKDSVLWGGTMRKTGVIILSFEVGEDMPSSLVAQLKEQFPMEFERNRRRHSDEPNERQSLIQGSTNAMGTEYGALQETQ